MSERVVVVVPGAEGGWIVRAFARESIDAIRAEPSDAPIAGAALIIDREVGELQPWLERFGGESILIGWGSPTDEEKAEPDIVAFYPRPVNLAGLIRRVQTMLEGAALPATPPESSLPPPADAGATLHDSSPPNLEGEAPRAPLMPTLAPPPEVGLADEMPELPPREPTVRLTADDEAAARAAAEGSGPPTGGESSVPPAEAIEDPEPEPEGEGSVERVLLSPRLAKLLHEADRRLFADEPPLELTFPAGDEAPAALVPDELLSESGTALEPREADPLEAFTFVGTPDLLDTASGGVPARAPTTSPSSSRPTRWSSARPDPPRPGRATGPRPIARPSPRARPERWTSPEPGRCLQAARCEWLWPSPSGAAPVGSASTSPVAPRCSSTSKAIRCSGSAVPERSERSPRS